MIEGERIRLRFLQLDDVNERYLQWLNDSDVMRYTESRFTKHSLDDIRAYVQAVQADQHSSFFAIIEKKSQKHIGNIKIGRIHNPYHRTADIGIIIGDKSCWGQGFATEAIKLLAAYAGETMNLHKLWAGIYANNIASIKAFLRAGFVEEGRFSKHWLCEGDYVDGIQLGMILEKTS